jgi:hypothetical protein
MTRKRIDLEKKKPKMKPCNRSKCFTKEEMKKYRGILINENNSDKNQKRGEPKEDESKKMRTGK